MVLFLMEAGMCVCDATASLSHLAAIAACLPLPPETSPLRSATRS